MKRPDIAHIAGLVDGAGSISASVEKEDGYKFGFRIRPSVRIQGITNRAILGKLDEYCEEQGVRYTVLHDDDVHTFVVGKDIDRFLEPLMDFLIDEYQPAMDMIENMLPLFENGHPDTKEAFLQAVHVADSLRSMSKHGKIKYDRRYFEDLWSEEAG